MHSTTASDDPIGDAVAAEFLTSLPYRGAGMHVRFDETTLRQLAGVRANDTLNIEYSVACVEQKVQFKAHLNVSLADPHGLFADGKIVDVLGALLAQMVEARLA